MDGSVQYVEPFTLPGYSLVRIPTRPVLQLQVYLFNLHTLHFVLTILGQLKPPGGRWAVTCDG